LEIGVFETTIKPIYGNGMGRLLERPLDENLEAFLFFYFFKIIFC
jgi:hypothetical protein